MAHPDPLIVNQLSHQIHYHRIQASNRLGPTTAGDLQLAAHQPDTVSFNAVLNATDAPEKVMEAVGMMG